MLSSIYPKITIGRETDKVIPDICLTFGNTTRFLDSIQTVFSYEIDTTKATSTYQLSTVVPFAASAVTTSYPSDVTIDWGDGSSDVIPYATTQVHNTQPNHTYATAGVYTIIITTKSGCMPAIGWEGVQSTYAPQVTKILTPLPTMYIYVSGDVAIPYDFNYNSGISQSMGMFFNCTNLTALPTKLFKNNPQIISTYRMFRSCTSLATIPYDLGWYFKKLYWTAEMFSYCTALTTITSPIFNNFYFYNNGAVVSIGNMFEYSGLQTVTSTIFANCKGVDGLLGLDIADIFYNARNLVSISAPIFRGNISSIAFNLTGLFYNCYALNGDNVVAYSNLNVTKLDQLYYNCRFTDISSDFVDYAKTNTTVTSVAQIFRANTYIAEVPDEVLAFQNCTAFDYAFYGCTKLKLNPNTFSLAEAKATRFASIATRVRFGNTFVRSSFTGEQGTAPDLWNYTFAVLPYRIGCYDGAGNTATSISNYADIPVEWS